MGKFRASPRLPFDQIFRNTRAAALTQASHHAHRPELADQRAILGPEAAVQRDETGSVGIRQIMDPESLFANGGCRVSPQHRVNSQSNVARRFCVPHPKSLPDNDK